MTEDLSDTQLLVVVLAMADLTDAHIADRLGVTVHGIDWQWREVFRKTECKSRVAAVGAILRNPVVAERVAVLFNSTE